MNALLSVKGAQVGRVLLTVWRACGRSGRAGAGLLVLLLVSTLALVTVPPGAAGLPGGRTRAVLSPLEVMAPSGPTVQIAGCFEPCMIQFAATSSCLPEKRTTMAGLPGMGCGGV